MCRIHLTLSDADKKALKTIAYNKSIKGNKIITVTVNDIIREMIAEGLKKEGVK